MDAYSKQEAQRRVGVMFSVMDSLIREKPDAMIDAARIVANVMRVMEEATQTLALMTPGAKIMKEGE
jgi:hypothetical protein